MLNKRFKIKRLILIVLIILIIIFIFEIKNMSRQYKLELHLLNGIEKIEIYSNKSKAIKAKKYIESLYKSYDKFVEKRKLYDNVINLYSLKNNKFNDEYLKIDYKLYDLLKYGLDVKRKTGGNINIELGNINDVWDSYLLSKVGAPSKNELTLAYRYTNSIKLNNNNMILNNHPNIDVNSILDGYILNKVKEYLDSKNIDSYIIYSNDDIIVGNKKGGMDYNIGLVNPDDISKIYKIVKGNNIYISTARIKNTNDDVDKTRYYSIINGNTLEVPDYYKAVTVISKGKIEGYYSAYLFTLSLEDGKKYIEKNDDLEAIWYMKNGDIETSSNFKNYIN